VAVYHNEIYYLSKYLGDRDIDLANHIPEFLAWGKGKRFLSKVGILKEELEEAREESSDEFYKICDQISAAMSDKDKEDFVSLIAHKYPIDAPAWAHLSLERKRIPRQTWLIHFSDQASDISVEGFTRGVSDMEQIALTTWLHDNTKKYGGYNFAFIAGNRASQRAASEGYYGKHAVMFQSSGLEVYHYGDRENQVIFWGKAIDPRTIVELNRDHDMWIVAPRFKSSMSQKGRDYVYRDTFEGVVNWVEHNWFQYRKQIMGAMRLSNHYSTLRIAAHSREVPSAPGETPIPLNHVRLYHYTRWPEGTTEEQAAERLWQGGIDIGKARGSTYGEPNVVWGSTQLPNRGKVYAEFSVHKDDPRWGIGKPRTSKDVDWLHKSGADVTFMGSIKPEEIMAVHMPWHHTYRYLKEHNMFPEVLNGDYDYLLEHPDSDEAKVITYIKNHHGK
jgi:hypothetical protein